VSLAHASINLGILISSANGSPLDHSEDEPGVVATVMKMRKSDNAAVLNINIGDGKIISLKDPSMLMELDEEMKSSAISQIQTFREQISTWMALFEDNTSKQE
jgi:hypothetical protein